MDTKVQNGNYVLNANGLPDTVEGLEEQLQLAELSLRLRRGTFPYNRKLGSGLWQWQQQGGRQENQPGERALALANEALLEMPGLRATQARLTDRGVEFDLETPLGEGVVKIGEL